LSIQYIDIFSVSLETIHEFKSQGQWQKEGATGSKLGGKYPN